MMMISSSAFWQHVNWSVDANVLEKHTVNVLEKPTVFVFGAEVIMLGMREIQQSSRKGCLKERTQ